jgi:glycosyltransferase involved in cell wall biosynthesis
MIRSAWWSLLSGGRTLLSRRYPPAQTPSHETRVHPMKPCIKVAFAAGSDELNARLVERMRRTFPELPLYVVSEFPPGDADLHWVRYDLGRGLDNLGRCRAAFRGKSIRLAGVLLVPRPPIPAMRLLALWLAPLYFLAVNENLDDFLLLRARSVPLILRHLTWRTRSFLAWHFRKHIFHRWRVRLFHASARLCGRFRVWKPVRQDISLLEDHHSRTLVCSRRTPPSAEALRSLHSAFESLPDLFCASLEFRSLRNAFETDSALCETALGKAGIVYSLYGGACSLYDTAKLGALGGLNAGYRFHDVAALELSYRAWQQGWPTVFLPAAATTEGAALPVRSTPRRLLVIRHYRDYLYFLVQSVSARTVFGSLWREANQRLARAASGQPAAVRLLKQASGMALRGRPSTPRVRLPEDVLLALTDGSVSVFSGRAPAGKPRIVIASPYLPFPLSHGGAVRMYNLARRAVSDFDQILVAFTDSDDPPAPEILDLYLEVVLVRRVGTHAHPNAGIPDAVQDFDSAPFHAALRQAVSKWRAPIVQMEFTQMGQYCEDCVPARTILVEHDVTLDLYRQMAEQNADWDTRQQFKLWSRFEKRAWRKMDLVVTMSEKDRAMVTQARAAVLPNGVDLDRFRKAAGKPESSRILFIGSFAHLPNLLAMEFFLREVWPLLRNATLHIIAGANHRYFLSHYRHRATVDIEQPGVEVDDFVADVRPAYERAAVVIAPLPVSAGTNLKILEAMALEKPVVSTSAGVNGLDFTPGEEFLLVHTAAQMAEAIEGLMDNPAERERLGAAARRRVERQYNWDVIARRQTELYHELLKADLTHSRARY